MVSTEGDVDKTSPLTEIGGRGVFTNAIEVAILGRGRRRDPLREGPSVRAPSGRTDRGLSRSGRSARRLDLAAWHDAGSAPATSGDWHVVTATRCAAPATATGRANREHPRQHRHAPAQGRGPEFDGIVLAAAGIRRMGWQDRISEYFPVERVVPSPGQGAMRFKPGPGVTPPLSWRALTTQASPPQSVSNGRSWPRSAWAPSRLAPTPRGQAMDTAWSRCSPMPRAMRRVRRRATRGGGRTSSRS